MEGKCEDESRGLDFEIRNLPENKVEKSLGDGLKDLQDILLGNKTGSHWSNFLLKIEIINISAGCRLYPCNRLTE